MWRWASHVSTWATTSRSKKPSAKSNNARTSSSYQDGFRLMLMVQTLLTAQPVEPIASPPVNTSSRNAKQYSTDGSPPPWPPCAGSIGHNACGWCSQK